MIFDNGHERDARASGEFEFYVIATRQAERFGVFIFNKTVLSENRILTSPKGKGKRGIRVYPNWSVTENKQAQKTQNWQTKYFVEIGNSNEMDLNKLKKLLKIELEKTNSKKARNS